VSLRWRWHEDWFGTFGAHELVEVYWRQLPEERYGPDPRPTIASCGFEVVAALLAEPLRQAFKRHLDEHGCAEIRGFAYCPEAMRLFDLLPDGDRVVIG
jgi:hypothetical protein